MTNHNGKRWHDVLVDDDLKDEWLDRMNAIPGIVICGTCSGGGSGTPPGPSIGFLFIGEGYESPVVTALFIDIAEVEPFWNGFTTAFQVRAREPRWKMGKVEFDDWWELVIARLEQLTSSKG